MTVTRDIETSVHPDEATGLYDGKRLAALLGVKPTTVRSLRKRNQLPEPTSTDINGGAVWAREIVEDFFHLSQPSAATHQVNPGLPKIVDLFSGCGGMSLGFQLAGFEVLAGFDNWKSAVATYRANLGHDASVLDLNDVEVTIEALAEFEGEDGFPAIIGGPPCQDFSSAGRRVEGARADLTEKFATIVERFDPPFFVMENVARAEGAAVFKRALKVMQNAGYAVDKIVLDASLCGVPQKRKRLITIGAKSKALTESVMASLVANQAKEAMTVREWFGDRLGTDTYYRHPRSYARRGVFSVDEPSPTVRGVNRPIPLGYPGHPGDAADVSSTRPLTTAERAEIQTFPQGFKFVGSRTDTEQMIGNAVPVRLAKFVAKAVSGSLSAQSAAASLSVEQQSQHRVDAPASDAPVQLE